MTVVCVVASEEIKQLKKELTDAQKQTQLQSRDVPSSVTSRRASSSRHLDDSDNNDDVCGSTFLSFFLSPLGWLRTQRLV